MLVSTKHIIALTCDLHGVNTYNKEVQSVMRGLNKSDICRMLYVE